MTNNTLPSIEEEIFDRKKPDFQKLISYGFAETDEGYAYSRMFLDGAFRADLIVGKDGSVHGSIIETELDEPYLPLRVASLTSGYVMQVRNAYKALLKEIADSCFIPQYFHSAQANRIALQIDARYHEAPDYPFATKSMGAVFRNHITGRWYGLVQNVERKKLQKKKKDAEGSVEIFDLRSDPSSIRTLIEKPGVYPAFHMNKKNWIAITMDDSMSDAEILQLIDVSRRYTEGLAKKANVPLEDHVWIIPANPHYFDIVAAFRREKTIIWKQSTHIEPGDLCYMYVGAPYSCILYKCEVKEVNIPYKSSGVVHISNIMRIHLLQTYQRNLIDARVLRHYGVGNVQGPRRMPVDLKKAIDQIA